MKSCDHDLDSDTVKYFPNPQNHMTDTEMHNKPDIRRLQMQFSNVTVSSLYSVKVIWRNYKKNSYTAQCNIRETEFGNVTMGWLE